MLMALRSLGSSSGFLRALKDIWIDSKRVPSTTRMPLVPFSWSTSSPGTLRSTMSTSPVRRAVKALPGSLMITISSRSMRGLPLKYLSLASNV